MTVAHVQTVGGTASASTITSLVLTIGAGHATTAGNFLVLFAAGGTSTLSIADSQSNTWSYEAADTGANSHPFLASCPMDVAALGVGDTITITCTSGTPHMFFVEEFSGVLCNRACPVVQAVTSASPTASSVTAPATSPGDLVIGIFATDTVPTGTAFTPGAGYTALSTQNSTMAVYGEYQIDSGAGAAYTPNATLGSSVAVRLTASLYGAKPNALVPTPPVNAVLDNFNRSDAASPPSASWGGVMLSGGANLQDNGASNNVVTFGGVGASYWNTTYGPNCEVYATATTLPGGGNSMRLWLRVTSPGTTSLNGYSFTLNDSATTNLRTFKILRYDANVATTIGTVTHNFAAGNKIAFTAVGPILVGWLNANGSHWAPVLIANDSTYSASGNPGLGIDFGTGVMDDFGGGTLLPAAPTANFAIAPRT